MIELYTLIWCPTTKNCESVVDSKKDQRVSIFREIKFLLLKTVSYQKLFTPQALIKNLIDDHLRENRRQFFHTLEG